MIKTPAIGESFLSWLWSFFAAGEYVVKDDGAWGIKSDGTWALFNATNECDECCPTITTTECTNCEVDTFSTTYQLDLTGIVDGDLCTDCENMNGTYVIENCAYNPTLLWCGKEDTFENTHPCGSPKDCYRQIDFTVSASGGNTVVYAEWHTTSAAFGCSGTSPGEPVRAPYIEYQKTITGTADCLFDGLVLPFLSQSSNDDGDLHCDANFAPAMGPPAPSECAVTAIPEP